MNIFDLNVHKQRQIQHCAPAIKTRSENSIKLQQSAALRLRADARNANRLFTLSVKAEPSSHHSQAGSDCATPPLSGSLGLDGRVD
jgi:hypothetical protein